MTETMTVKLQTTAVALEFFPKMRVGIEHGLRWHQRVWRWLMKRNWRVRDVDYRTKLITLERCR